MLEGSHDALMSNAEVQRAYLGTLGVGTGL